MPTASPDRIELRRRIEARLKETQPASDLHTALLNGVTPALNRQFLMTYPEPSLAAVLVPIVDREEGLTVMLTQRSAQLRNHAGQISLPGGRVDASDDGPIQTALRETEEEIGLSREYVQVAGYLAPQPVLTGFLITPVVGLVRPGFSLKLNSIEVDSVFEVPLVHLLDEANHLAHERQFGDAPVRVYDIPFGNHHIWGATAGILLSLYRLLRSE